MGDRRPLPVVVVDVSADPALTSVLDALAALPVLVIGVESSLPAPAALGGAVLIGAPGAAMPERAERWARNAVRAGLPVLGVGAGAAAVEGLAGSKQPVAAVEDPYGAEGRDAIASFVRALTEARLGRLPARRCSTEARRRDIYREALDLLAEHEGRLRLDQAAAELYVSRRQLQRVFAENGATTFSEAKRRVA